MELLVDIIARLSGIIVDTEESAKDQFNLSNLTPTQMRYIETINLLNNPSITELATKLNLSKPTVKVAIDKFIEKDYVFKVRSDEDRRSAHLHLSEKGKLINQIHEYAHKVIAESFSRKLNSDEKEILISLLLKVLKEN